METLKESSNKIEYLNIKIDQADNLRNLSHFQESIKLLIEAEEDGRRICANEIVERALNGRALILNAFGKYQDALTLLEQDEKICRLMDDRRSLTICLYNQASNLNRLGRLDEALSLLHESENTSKEINYLCESRVKIHCC